MSFTVENLEFYLLVLVRVSAFVMAAPFLGNNSVPMRVRAALSVFLALIVIQITPVITLHYSGVVGYAVLILKETLLGVTMGLMCNMCFYIVNLAGQLMDMELGLSMANMFDPMTGSQVSLTSRMYNYVLLLMMVVTNMHYYVIRAIVDSFSYFNVGEAIFRLDALKEAVVKFVVNYFLIGFRIVLPVFCCMLLINVVLGVLTRAAPQMNMFVVGIQIKVIVGFIVLLLIVQSFPMVANFVFDEMKSVVSEIIRIFAPSG